MITIGIVGKYVQLHDAYLSVVEALRHAGYDYGTKVNLEWLDSETINEENVGDMLASCDGIIVPGGFGNRGIDGKIAAAGYCRTHNLPYLGICLGMQVAVIEYARHVCGFADANSGEFDPNSTHKVIDFLPDQSEETNKGGTLRLGAYPCRVTKGVKCMNVTAVSAFQSVTATDMNLIICSEKHYPMRDFASAAHRRTAILWKRWKCRKTIFTSAYNSIRNLRAVLISRTRFLKDSLAPRWLWRRENISNQRNIKQ